jgi:hypothetical protein
MMMRVFTEIAHLSLCLFATNPQTNKNEKNETICLSAHGVASIEGLGKGN